ncbi:MAG: phosphopantetheine-binding protein [Bacteroidales bacterium]|nr:phosphopantetheine-binding protein [Bacteroidales bacterium]
MTEQEIFEKLKEVLKQIKPRMDTGAVTMDSSLTTDLGMDSLAMLLISFACEDKFKIRFEPKVQFRTVKDVVEYISKEHD